MTNVLIGRSRNRNENLDTGGNRSYKEKNENTTYRLKREVSKETALEFRPPASKTMKTVHLGCGSYLICATLLLKPQGTNASISKLIQTSPAKDVETEFSEDKMSFQRSLRIEVGLRVKNTRTSIQCRVHLRTCILFLFACFIVLHINLSFPFLL